MTGSFRLSRFAGRPLLLAPQAAVTLAERVRAFDARALNTPRAWLDKPAEALARLTRAKAGDAEGASDAPPLFGPPQVIGYAPRYAGEPTHDGPGFSVCSGIACLEINGPLMDRGFQACGETFWGYDLVAEAVAAASADDAVRGVFIRFDTPGGVIAGELEVATAALRGARAAAGGKPIWAYCAFAASAGYWLAAQADRILAPPVGQVGSIGAVYVHEEYSAALAAAGVAVTAIQFGAKKTDAAPFKPLSAAARADLQAEIDECGRRFVADVARGRPRLTAEAQLATEAGLFLAHHADPARSGFALGLVDQIAHEADAFAQLVAHVAAAAPVAPRARSTPNQPPQQPAAYEPKEKPVTKATHKRRTAAGKRRRVAAMTPDEQVTKIEEILDSDLPAEDKVTLIRQTVGEEPTEAPAEDAPTETTDAAPAAEGEDPEKEAVDPAPADEDDAAPADDEEDSAPDGKNAVASERARVAAILKAPEAKGREALAQQLVMEGVSAAAARRVLAASPKLTSALDRLATAPNPRLGAGGGAEETLSAEQKRAREALAAHRAATGQKPKS